MKGSAFRCIKTGDPIDPVLEKAAREAGMEIREIKENLPEDLAVWVDPGEVSYRIGEKGLIKILYSEAAESATQEESLDKEHVHQPKVIVPLLLQFSNPSFQNTRGFAYFGFSTQDRGSFNLHNGHVRTNQVWFY
ncbi:hypothetical protein HAZT_HAZT011510 [Hyalella azteca]|uniref:Anti-proliferative protein domain-containing protein n=1 Tax=Hyalella azteca TaxID=294128 RepID=A0A6A0GTM2_HYAAZ|nr:hypothetical protein HAZT_HAZT011510 [Hyalella azteca]